jgi:hypothetical protein
LKRLPCKVNRNLDRIGNALNDIVERSTRRSFYKDSKFVFAHPCNENIGAERRDDLVADLPQAEVSRILTVGVVDLPKAIEIKKDKSHGIAQGIGSNGTVCQLFPECDPAVETRQTIDLYPG